jgi:hypothetical protein
VRLAIIVDKDETISRWQFEALNIALLDKHEIDLILVSEGKVASSHKSLRNFLYYILAIASRYRVKSLSRIGVAKLKIERAKKIYFNPDLIGIWESLPNWVLSELSEIDLIIKFGMGLLGNSEKIPTKFGVLSYHHGDPSQYRGRPAGFWETLKSENIMGVIVQQLSKSLDGGVIRAMGFLKVSKTSYKKTMQNMYEAGVPLLRKAINNCERDINISYEKSAKVFKLPTNKIVVKFLFKQLREILQRIKYGAFMQKSWVVAKTEFFGNFETKFLIRKNQIEIVPKPDGFTFVADPAGKLNNFIYCELLNAKTGLGEIGLWDSQIWKILKIEIKGHKSYPQIISDGGKSYLFPEISQISSPALFELDASGEKIISTYHLKGLENTRHVDATLFWFQGYWYLFSGNTLDSGQRLNLYTSKDLFAEFTPHPNSPIVLDPRNSRMAGPIQIHNSNIYRLSQDCSDRYGSKIQINKVNLLTPCNYSESQVGSVEIENAFGPHTFLRVGQEIWFDFYNEIFDFKAGYRRLIGKIRNFSVK